ncbi:MAG: hypothetical protein R3E76_06095 [Planctomycetota bacterium]
MAISKKHRSVVRASAGNGTYSAAALVGVNSVILGWSMDENADRSDLLGFAVRRTDYDPDTGETLRLDWLSGQKRFAGLQDDAGFDVRSDQAPFQRFRWGDYTVNPKRSYRYEIFPMRGKPGDLERDGKITLNVRPTENVADGIGVYFNRGVTAAPAYMRRFRGLHPEEIAGGEACASGPGWRSLRLALAPQWPTGARTNLPAALHRRVTITVVHERQT